MLFSEYYGIEIAGDEPWFDPLLTLDTRLYVDPFLIFQNEFGPFVGAHEELTAFYQSAYELVAEAGTVKTPHFWNKAIRILRTPAERVLRQARPKQSRRQSIKPSNLGSLTQNISKRFNYLRKG